MRQVVITVELSGVHTNIIGLLDDPSADEVVEFIQTYLDNENRGSHRISAFRSAEFTDESKPYSTWANMIYGVQYDTHYAGKVVRPNVQ